MLKRAIKACLAWTGLEIRRIPQESPELYRGYSSESIAQRRFYNVGAAGFYHPSWTNIDYATDWYRSRQKHPFLNFDLTSLEPLPIEAGCAEIVYSSHTIEHISDKAAANFLSECYRILKPGGILRLTMPDFSLARGAFRRGDQSFFSSVGIHASLPQSFVHFFATQLVAARHADPAGKLNDAEIIKMFAEEETEQQVNRLTSACAFDPDSPGNHINWWTYGKAESFLRTAGFSTVYRSGYGQSAAVPLRNIHLFDNTYPQMSLYVEAIR